MSGPGTACACLNSFSGAPPSPSSTSSTCGTGTTKGASSYPGKSGSNSSGCWGAPTLRLDLVDEAKTAWDALLQQDPDGPYKALIEAELAPVSSDIEVVQVDPDG